MLILHPVMKRVTLLPLLICFLLMAACSQRRKDAVYYEHLLDSIRQAEQLQQLQQTTGVCHDPVEAFFDTLRLRSLPMQSAGTFKGGVEMFTQATPSVTSLMGFPADADLRIVALPRYRDFRVVMLAEMQDSITPTISLVTLDRQYHPVDELCVYEEWDEDRSEAFGRGSLEFFVTSQYNITLMRYFRRYDSETSEVEQTTRYNLSHDGHFHEVEMVSDGK